MYQDQSSAYASPISPVDTSPRPFGEIPPLWVKVTQMTEDFFAQEAPRASLLLIPTLYKENQK